MNAQLWLHKLMHLKTCSVQALACLLSIVLVLALVVC